MVTVVAISAASGRECNGRGKSILGFVVALLSESHQYTSSAGVSFFPSLSFR